jgi:protocatechuate 3,4-dioxygenase beta subunit
VLLASVTISAQGRGGAQGSAGASPTPIIRTASVAGQVVDADSGAPISGAIVQLQSRLLAAAAGPAPRQGGGPVAPPGSDAVISDSDGRFVFHDLPKGATQLTASAAGYLDRPVGTPQRPIQLQDGQHLDGIRLPLQKGASVTGIVLDEAGEPVVGLTVRVLRQEMPQGVPRLTLAGGARTDDRGQYRLDALVPGQLYVLAPQSLTTLAASQAEQLGAVAGLSNPLIEAMTGGMQTSFGPTNLRVGDQMLRLDPAIGGGGGAAPPPPINGRLAAYPTTFYPGVTQLSQAMPIALKSGEERIGIDFQIHPTAAARVSGVLLGPTGPAAGTMIKLVPAPGRTDDEPLTVGTTTTGPDGTFTFLGVPAGQYVAKATAAPRGAMLSNISADTLANMPVEMQAALQARMSSGEASFLRTAVTVGDRDVTDLSWATRLGAKVSGRIVFDGTAAKPATLTNVQVSLTQGAGNGGFASGAAKVTADATFQTGTYPPGTYSVNVVGVPGPWLLRSLVVAGRDVLRTGMEIGENDLTDIELTYTDRPAAVTGFVRQDSADPLPNATVLLLASDYRAALAASRSPRQQTAAVQPTGAFTLGRLLAGDYIIVALLDDALPANRDLAFYDAAARAGTRVTVAEGESKAIDLKIVRSLR